MDFDQTHWVATQRRTPLPTFYYRDHFCELLDFVDAHYAHVLDATHRELIDEFAALSPAAQGLYVRLVNRKGRVFARGKLRYPELGELDEVIAELIAGRWLGPPDESHYDDVLKVLTRAELYAVLLPRFAGISRSLKKPELVAFARAELPATAFLAAVDERRLLVQRRQRELRYLLFLYFGRIQDGLTRFTMRDLGLVNTQSASADYEPRFADRDEAAEHFFFAERLHLATDGSEESMLALVAEIERWPAANFSGSAALRDRLAERLGKAMQAADEPGLARKAYAAGESANCVERGVRLLLANGGREAAERYLEERLDAPRGDEEWLVARDLYERHFQKKRTTAATDLLRAAEEVAIDESRCGAPERALAGHFEALGVRVFRTENALWRTLFGLYFWDELFATDEASNSPFERLPALLEGNRFYADRRERIEHKLAALADRRALKKTLLTASTRHYGTANGVFRWRRSTNEAVFALADVAPASALAAVLRRFCEDYKSSRYGYPDLFLIDDDGPRFVEVKSEGDQLRRNQLLRLEQLRAAGFRADVVRVRWILDPKQSYVVVDVETTGGRGEHHRVTEIGAVKVQGGEIVDRFATLINPQRSIPPAITRLTGITPAMVAEAPYFFDVADEFERFLDGSIFVAHNVEFDYGFIGREFRRIGRPFRMPKLCTCASMRRLYPGHRSYSLAALCRAYDIPLESHHRALCDAEAAAQLLLIVNEKRQAA